MPTISVFYGIVIQMYFRDHLPPHFHIRCTGHLATFDIHKLILMAGTLPAKELRLVSNWAKLHQVNYWKTGVCASRCRRRIRFYR